MSIIADIFSGGIGGIVKGVGEIIDDVTTSDEERGQMELEKRRLQLEEAKLLDRANERQVEVNKQEAKHRSLFVSGWRPFIGWTCGAGLAWHYIIHDLVTWAVINFNPDIVPPVLVGTEELLTLTFALLGFGGMRSWEKWKGLTK